MRTKSAVTLSLKIIVLTVLYLIVSTISYSLLSFGLPQPPEDQMSIVLLGTVLIGLVNTVVSAIIILRSRWHGWQLAGATAFSMYGVATVMTTIEAVYFAPALGTPYREMLGMLPGYLLPNLVLLAVFIPVAVRFLGKWYATDEVETYPERAVMPRKQWAVKLVAIAIIYYAIYFSFGYVVAWSNPNLQAMYAEGANNTLLMVWGVIPLALFRGVLWVLFALPVIRMTKAKPWQLALLVGLLYSLPMSIGLIIPNELMPDASARMSHFVEITTSNFIFGMIVVWLVHRSHSSLRALFRPAEGRAQITPDEVEARAI